MIARSFAITLIALFIFLISIPGYSLAVSEHAGHDGLPTNGQSQGEAMTSSHNNMQHGSGQSGHDQAGSVSHSQDSSEHGEQSGGHGDSGKGGPEPVKNLLVGGFAGINALIIGIALYMKNKLQRGVAG
ncbi:MAG: hypothetical protein M1130_04890 [Actinobacteria bacterium]|nr:hypothetical protein [Actinomycetota bacterium]